MGIRDKPIAPGSPWQNGFAEDVELATLHRAGNSILSLVPRSGNMIAIQIP
jgi:hypothetical protein